MPGHQAQSRQPLLSIFLPHGSPMMALNPGPVGEAMKRAVTQLPPFHTIVVVSPHWETEVAEVSSAPHLETIHDFGNFDPRLFDIHWKARGSAEGADRVMKALQAAHIPVQRSTKRGLDHGAWIPLRLLFEEDKYPIVPLSVQHHLGPEYAFRVGEALHPLTLEGYLVVGSGAITHNIGEWHKIVHGRLPIPDYVKAFPQWIYDKLEKRDRESLVAYRSLNPDGKRAHPRDEHLLPLFYAFAAAGKEAEARPFYQGVADEIFSMDGYLFF